MKPPSSRSMPGGHAVGSRGGSDQLRLVQRNRLFSREQWRLPTGYGSVAIRTSAKFSGMPPVARPLDQYLSCVVPTQACKPRLLAPRTLPARAIAAARAFTHLDLHLRHPRRRMFRRARAVRKNVRHGRSGNRRSAPACWKNIASSLGRKARDDIRPDRNIGPCRFQPFDDRHRLARANAAASSA